ncbi:MAG: Histidinol-phosphate aminotransferase [Methanoregula sp. SKADARSKE-2]|nr:MAG: Histidinol-phosphate aminotransferase [Methanoregula sp. SKADARSKE-2]
MEHLVRPVYKEGGYAFARKAEDIASEYGIERVARLASNENPEPPSPLATGAAKRAIHRANRYPDEKTSVLVQGLRAYYGDYHFVAGVGMDGVIETLIRTIVSPNEAVVVTTPTFSFYSLAARAQEANVLTVPRERDFSVKAEEIISAGEGAKMVILCTPNNPTGNATSVEVVQEILEGIDGILFLDNAYVEFSDFDYLPLLKDHGNLVIGRTLSKVHSLAGFRVGYAFAPEWLVPYYQRAATPFTVNSVSAAAAAGALLDREHAERYIGKVKQWRKRFRDEVKYPVHPSDANFVMVDVSPLPGDAVVERLARRGVIVRSCRSFTGLPDHYIRVSVGEDWENEMFIGEINAL